MAWGGEVREHNGEVVTEKLRSDPCRRGSWKRLLQQSRCRSESGSRAQPVPVNHPGYGLRLKIPAPSAAAEGLRAPIQQSWKPQLPSPPAERVLSVCREKPGLAAGELWESGRVSAAGSLWESCRSPLLVCGDRWNWLLEHLWPGMIFKHHK